MIYSVWDPRRQLYVYHQTAGVDTESPVPTHLTSRDPRGLTPEEASWPLPPGTAPVGAGPQARGMIATSRASGGLALAGVDMSTNWLVLVGLIASAYGLYRVLTPRQRHG